MASSEGGYKMKAELDTLLEDMRQRRLYGSIDLKIEAGKIELLCKTETFLASTFERNRGHEHDGSNKQPQR
jgi:hypothetical protein